MFRYPEEPEVSYIKRLVGLAWRDHPDLSTAMSIVKSAGSDSVHAGPQADATSSRRCRSTSTTIAIGPRALAEQGRVAAVARRHGGWKLVEPDRESVSVRRRHRRTSGPSCATAISCPTPSNGTRSMHDRPLPRPPRATLITDFYSYNTNMSADSPTCSTTFSETRRAHGCSLTGLAI